MGYIRCTHSGRGTRLRRPTLVLAEDDPATAELFTGILEEYFEIVGVVADGEALVEFVHRLQPDAIVSDLGLKGLNGMLAALRIRRRFPEVPIVLMTADYDAILHRTGLSVGASEFLSKVEAEGVLVDVLRRLLHLDTGSGA
jgi:CheY-like chemotaxis protein